MNLADPAVSQVETVTEPSSTQSPMPWEGRSVLVKHPYRVLERVSVLRVRDERHGFVRDEGPVAPEVGAITGLSASSCSATTTTRCPRVA